MNLDKYNEIYFKLSTTVFTTVNDILKVTVAFYATWQSLPNDTTY